MTDISGFVLPLTAGFVSAVLYHTALWWSVRSIPYRKRPVVFAVCSFFVRMGCTVTVFYYVLDGFLGGPLFVGGFLTVRYGVTRYVRST